jgi:hypothetical protein
MKGYDLGGAEWPYAPELYVVDIEDPAVVGPRPEELNGPVLWIKKDLREKDWHVGLEKLDRVYMGKTLRYLDAPATYEDDQAKALDALAATQITLFDWLSAMDEVLTGLIRLGWTIVEMELVNVGEDNPSEWTVTLERR